MIILAATGSGNYWIFYLVGGLLILAVIGIIVAFFLHRKFAVKLFKQHAWKKLYNLAEDQDFYLLNNVQVKTESESLHINHLLVGDKFIYVIAVRYYEDDLKGESFHANRWQVVDKNGSPLREVFNPVLFNDERTMILAKFLGWNSTKSPMFISIVVVNDSTKVDITDPTISHFSYLVHKRDVTKLIKKIEKEADYAPFDDQALMKIVQRIHRLSLDAAQDEALEKGEAEQNK
jgi:hypothetical protein